MKSFFRSFKYAFDGLLFCIRNERNFRIHLCAAFFVIGAAIIADFSGTAIAVVCATVSLVLFAEISNTALEKAIDLFHPNRDELAKRAKDLAAGAVLITAALAIGAAIALFLENRAYIKVFLFFKNSLPATVILCVLAAAAVLFICFGGKKVEK